MANKVLILGNGYFSKRISEELGYEICEDRINCLKDALNIIAAKGPEVIINCVGRIGRNVDDCELDKDATLMANTFVPFILAEAALRNNIKFVHISSGCIYHYDYAAEKPISEEKMPDYFNLFYSRAKIYSEQGLLALTKEYPVLILRPRVPLDNRPSPKNLLTKLITYKKVISSPNSATYMPDFIRALEHLIKINARGIYNTVNKNPLKYPDLMRLYKKYVPDFQYEVIGAKELNTPRTNLVLSTEKLEKSGFKVRAIEEVLEECVKGYIKY